MTNPNQLPSVNEAATELALAEYPPPHPLWILLRGALHRAGLIDTTKTPATRTSDHDDAWGECAECKVMFAPVRCSEHHGVVKALRQSLLARDSVVPSIVSWVRGLEVVRQRTEDITNDREEALAMKARRGVYEGIADEIESKWGKSGEARSLSQAMELIRAAFPDAELLRVTEPCDGIKKEMAAVDEKLMSEAKANLHMVLARLDSAPSSVEEWDAIVSALKNVQRFFKNRMRAAEQDAEDKEVSDARNEG